MIEQIWRQFHQQLLVFIRAKVNDHAIAEDILQDVFVKVHQNIGHLTNQSKLQPWLYQICRNTIVDFYRSKALIVVSSNLDDSLVKDLNETITAKESHQDQEQLNRCIALLIADLPEKYSDILVRSELLEQKQQIIADQEKLSLAAVKSRIIRGRDQLKKKLQACCDFEFDELGPQASCKSHCGCEK